MVIIWEAPNPIKTFNITQPLIGGWRITPENNVLRIEIFNNGEYSNFTQYSSEGEGNWYFEITDSADGSMNNKVLLKYGSNIIRGFSSENMKVVKWELNLNSNETFSFTSFPDTSETQRANQTARSLETMNSSNIKTNLSELLVTNCYTEAKPAEKYLQSLCCIKQHYRFILKLIYTEKNILVQELGKREIECLLTLIKPLEQSLIQDMSEELPQPSSSTIQLLRTVFEYFFSASLLYLINSEGNKINNFTSLCQLSAYGILRLKCGLNKFYPSHLSGCWI